MRRVMGNFYVLAIANILFYLFFMILLYLAFTYQGQSPAGDKPSTEVFIVETTISSIFATGYSLLAVSLVLLCISLWRHLLEQEQSTISTISTILEAMGRQEDGGGVTGPQQQIGGRRRRGDTTWVHTDNDEEDSEEASAVAAVASGLYIPKDVIRNFSLGTARSATSSGIRSRLLNIYRWFPMACLVFIILCYAARVTFLVVSLFFESPDHYNLHNDYAPEALNIITRFLYYFIGEILPCLLLVILHCYMISNTKEDQAGEMTSLLNSPPTNGETGLLCFLVFFSVPAS